MTTRQAALEGWRTLYKVLQAISAARVKEKEDHFRTRYFKTLVPPNNSMQENEYILVTAYPTTVRATWFMNYQPIVTLDHVWHHSAAEMRLVTGGDRSSALRERLNAALRITNGWQVYQKKIDGQVRWFVASMYEPFPKNLSEALLFDRVRELVDDLWIKVGV